VLKIIGELLGLIKWFITTNNAKEFRDDVEDIKSDPSGSWSKRFGRVQSDKRSGDDTIKLDGSSSELPSSDSESPRR
jgi:hypothetical protein